MANQTRFMQAQPAQATGKNPVQSSSQQLTMPSTVNEPVETQEPPTKKKHSLWWMWLIIGLIVGAGLSAVYFLFIK